MRRADSLEKTLMLGGIGGRRKRGRQRMRQLDGITDSMDMSLSELRVSEGQGGLVCCDSWGHKESDTTERLNWTELKRQGREKPTKIEQKKVLGQEWGPQVKQTTLLAGPIYTGQAQGDKHIKRGHYQKDKRCFLGCYIRKEDWFDML